MFLVPIAALLLWAGWTLLAASRPRNPRLATVLSSTVLSVSVAVVVAYLVGDGSGGKTIVWFLGPAIVLSALRLTQAVRRVGGDRS
ncbi:hypothetical protein IQ279_08225 [Streptomyces verrucosisporus]|uniref:hypothetical protein n=1 Tax=Streptomyces verrucosisporus TaxID=1695161 RepID=UPI0019D25B03|nr:hypothetical protein [Streptomyces verrucosisporus]MBN3929626.1 hypothetical protein [Streptomyces verrucosisporus]